MKTIKWFIISLFAVLIMACDGGGGVSTGISQPSEPPPGYIDPDPDTGPDVPTMQYLNMNWTGVAYEYTPPSVGLTEILTFGETQTTNDSACIVVWQTADSLWCGCRSITADGPWPIMGPTNVATFMAAWTGPSRELSADEATVCDGIRDTTYCIANRIDGSTPAGCSTI